MKIKQIFLFLLIQFILSYDALGQKLMENFKMPTPITKASINVIKVDAENKILLAGSIDFYDGIGQPNLIRLNTNGTLDKNFNFNSDISLIRIELLSTGEIIGLSSDYIYKIDHSGSILKSVKIESPVSIAIKDDNVFFVSTTLGLKKYNSDLNLDISFNNENKFNGGYATNIAFQGNNILVSGTFNKINDTDQNSIARFDSNGNFDSTFNVGSGTSDYIGSLVIQNDGKIILCKTFINSFNGTQFKGLARLNANGSIDSGFTPPELKGGSLDVELLNDKILVSAFIEYGGTTENQLIRLNSNGTIDNTFTVIKGDISEIELMNDKSILTNSVNSPVGIYKYSINGALSYGFLPPLTKVGYFNNAAYYNGFIIVTGDFTALDGIETFQIGKINMNGVVAPNFKVTPELNTGSTSSGIPIEIKIKAENEIFVSLGNKLLKLNSYGTPINGFDTPSGVVNANNFNDTNFVQKFEFLKNGQIVTSGPNGVYLINQDGSQDATFVFKKNSSSTAFGMGIQSSENIIYGSSFTEVNGVSTNRLVRLNQNGSTEGTFNFGVGPNSSIYDLNILPNDEIIANPRGGEFNGLISNLDIFKLGINGKLDTEFINNINSNFEVQDRFLNGINHMNESFLFAYRDYSSAKESLGKIDLNGNIYPNFSVENDINVLKFSGKRLVGIDKKMFLLLGEFEIIASGAIRNGVLFIDDAPVVISEKTNLSTPESTPISLSTTDLVIEDVDNVSSGDFSLIILNGDNYTVSDNKIIPNQGFVGTLIVPLVVNDGKSNSETFRLSIEVKKTLGVEEGYFKNNFTVYPNPIQSDLTISFNDPIVPCQAKVFDLKGNLVFSEDSIESNKTINLNVLQKGVYILQIRSKDKIEIVKLLKE